MDHDASQHDHALELAKALRDAFKAWVYRDGIEGEVMISSDVLLQGVFGFAVPTIVGTLNLNERGAEDVTRLFARTLSDAIQHRRNRP